MRIIAKLLLYILFIGSASAFAQTNYYVSAEMGDDTNPGTEAAPFATMKKAADLTAPGDTVFVMNGEYRNNPWQYVLEIRNSGTPNNWIRYRNFPGHRPKIKFDSYGGIAVWGAAYVEIEGFEVEGNLATYDYNTANGKRQDFSTPENQGLGILVTKPYERNDGWAHHVRVKNNIVHDTTGAGITSIGVDYFYIEDNIVYRTGWYAPQGMSGISNFVPRNRDNRQDIYRMVITGNISHSNYNYFECSCSNFQEVTDGNGIILDSGNIQANPYTGRTLVANNIVYNNGARGINVFQNNNADVFNNTVYANLRHPDLDDEFAGQISVGRSENVRVFNNIIQVIGDDDRGLEVYGSTVGHEFSNNLVFGDSAPTVTGTDDILGEDPQFIQVPTLKPFGAPPQSAGLFDGTDYHLVADFHIQPNSPAINKGRTLSEITTDFDKQPRPQSSQYDIGADEAGGAVETVDISVVPSVNPMMFSAAGDELAVGVQIANSGDATLTKVVVSENQLGSICTTETLAADATETCSINYTVTPADVNAGEVVFSFRVSGDQFSPKQLSPLTVKGENTPAPALTAQAVVSPAFFTTAGEELTVSVPVSNTGNAELTNVTVSDALLGTLCTHSTLEVGAEVTCEGMYTVSATDANNGRIEFNIGVGSTQTPTQLLSRVVVGTTPPVNPDLTLQLEVTPMTFSAVGDRLDISAIVTNTGNAPMTNVSVTDPLLGTVCDMVSLWFGFEATCTGTYFVTEADVAAGAVVFNSSVVSDQVPAGVQASLTVATSGDSGNGGSGDDADDGGDSDNGGPTPPVDDSVLSVVSQLDSPSSPSVGDTLIVSITIANTSSAPLSNIVVDDPKLGVPLCTIDSLWTGLSATCTGSYTVSADDVGDVGAVTFMTNVTSDQSASVTSDLNVIVQ